MKPNASWFGFSVGRAVFGVYGFSGREESNVPYRFEIELVSRDAAVDLHALLGTEACLSILDKSGGCRYVHGIIRDMSQLHTGNVFTHYRCVLVPRLDFQRDIIEHRIFQRVSVIEIITTILKEQGFSDEAYSFKLADTYPARDYCVQYGESNLHFITRLCEEEGIYFYFEHTASGHCLCFTDREGGPRIPGEFAIRFLPGSGAVPDTAVVQRASLKHATSFNAAAYAEWNFEKPRLNLSVSAQDDRPSSGPTSRLENYQYPHLYSLQKPGQRYVELEVQRQSAFCTVLSCDSDVSRYAPGFTFTLFEHPRLSVNATWWIHSVSHKGEQPAVLEHEAPADRGFSYQSHVEAIPEDVRFVPGIRHPKRKVNAVQSAIVTGPQGEEIYTDQYGRVKVHFHWDRTDTFTENSSCWVRVSDRWAGDDFGFIQCPRIGQEVLVEFMEGDPDRPLITGRVYNRVTMPPWDLPSEKTLSGIQSREIGSGRRNQLVFNDTRNAIQAQLASDHHASELNLGHITRITHHAGRKDFRGEGFEVRTDAWGAARAARGLFISTDSRENGTSTQKDIKEAVNGLFSAVSQHSELADLAVAHAAQDASKDGSAVSSALDRQQKTIAGTGEPHGEFAEPHVLLSSPSGFAMTTAGGIHTQTDDHTAVTAAQHVSQCAGTSYFASALGKVSFFAHKLGMRFIAGSGKVSIEAQSDDLDMIAEKVASYICAKGPIRISSPKQIQLSAGGSFMRIGIEGIEKGTSGSWVVHSKSQKAKGPMEMDYILPAWDTDDMVLDGKVQIWDELGLPLRAERYAVNQTGRIDGSTTEHTVQLFHEQGGQKGTMRELVLNGERHIVVSGTEVALTNDLASDLEG